jgi:hypothetical protein
MELNGIRIVKIGDDLEFPIRYSNRALLAHLNREAKDPENLETVIQYYYDLAKTGAKFKGIKFDYTFDQFYDLIDPYPGALEKFNEAVLQLLGQDDGSKKKKQ